MWWVSDCVAQIFCVSKDYSGCYAISFVICSYKPSRYFARVSEIFCTLDWFMNMAVSERVIGVLRMSIGDPIWTWPLQLRKLVNWNPGLNTFWSDKTSFDLHFPVLEESLQYYLLLKLCPPGVVSTANAPMWHSMHWLDDHIEDKCLVMIRVLSDWNCYNRLGFTLQKCSPPCSLVYAFVTWQKGHTRSCGDVWRTVDLHKILWNPMQACLRHHKFSCELLPDTGPSHSTCTTECN